MQAQKLNPCFSLHIKNVTALLEPQESECMACQYHGRFNMPADFLERLMDLASYKTSVNPKGDDSVENLKSEMQEFIGLFEFIASTCWELLQ